MHVATALMVSLLGVADASGCGSSPISSGRHTFQNQGNTREYYVHVPSGYDQTQPTALVMLFHGWGYSGQEWYQGSGSGAVSATPTAERHNFILVSPTGLSDSSLSGNCNNGGGYCSWNGGGTTTSPGPEGATCSSKQRTNYCYRDTCGGGGGCNDLCWWTSCNDDVSMVHALLDKLEDELCVDATRVYAGGESNGAVFTWELGMDARAGRFAALATSIGQPHWGFARAPAVTPMPVLGLFGNTDRSIPPGNNNDGFTESSDGWYYTTARRVTRDWASAHGCSTSGNPTAYPTFFDGDRGLTCTSFSNGCEQSVAPVVDCRFNGGHTVNAFTPELFWEFFEKHSRPAALAAKAKAMTPNTTRVA